MSHFTKLSVVSLEIVKMITLVIVHVIGLVLKIIMTVR